MQTGRAGLRGFPDGGASSSSWPVRIRRLLFVCSGRGPSGTSTTTSSACLPACLPVVPRFHAASRLETPAWFVPFVLPCTTGATPSACEGASKICRRRRRRSSVVVVEPQHCRLSVHIAGESLSTFQHSELHCRWKGPDGAVRSDFFFLVAVRICGRFSVVRWVGCHWVRVRSLTMDERVCGEEGKGAVQPRPRCPP
jgi:hypothetical protein